MSNEQKIYEYDIFLSFTGADRELKDELKAYLSEGGLVCYDSDTYCKGRFRDDFCEALDKSRVYLMILTDNLRNDPLFSGKGKLTEVRRESAYACELEARNELNIVILCLSEFFRYENGFHDYNDILGWHFYTHTRGFSTIYGSVAPDGTLDERSLSEVKRECSEFSQKRKDGRPVVSQSPRIEISREKIIADTVFMGREEETNEVMNAFSSGKQMVVLSGLGGMGKTSLATSIAKKCEENGYFSCPQIVRIQEIKGNDDNINALLSSVSYEKSVYDSLNTLTEKERNERKMKALSSLPENVLLVIDNYNTFTKKDANRLLSKLKCRMLVTTRVRLPEDENYAFVKIGSLPALTAKEMFCLLYGNEVTTEEFNKIYSFVGGHTITLCIMAKMLLLHGLSVDGLLEEMESDGRDGAKVEFEHNDSDETDTVMGHLIRLFDISEFDEECKAILTNMSVLSDGTIGRDELVSVLSLKNRNAINALIKSGWLEEKNEQLFLHPVLSKTVSSLLAPTETSASGMINYLIGCVENAEKGLTYKDARYFANKLFYACFIIAKSSGQLSDTLWEKFIRFNSLFADANETELKAKELVLALSTESDKATVQAYSDMISFQQYPTRTEIIDKYLQNLEASSNDYKWVMRSLSTTFSHIFGIEKYRDFLKRALNKAVKSAIFRCDDFALIDLVPLYLMVEKKKVVFSLVKPYIKARKKEKAISGDLMAVESNLNYYEFIAPKDGVDYFIKLSEIFEELAEERYGNFLWQMIKHPIAYAKVASAQKRMQVLPDDDPMKVYLTTAMGVGEKLVLDGKLDVKTLLLATISLHKRKLDEGYTLASADKIAMSMLSLFGSFPPAQVEKDNKMLLGSLDLDNLSVEDFSVLQVSTLLNRLLNNREALEQGEKVVRAVRLLRPQGHGDILDALISYGDCCLAFKETGKAIPAYLEVYNALKATAPDSTQLREVAQKIIKTIDARLQPNIDTGFLQQLRLCADKNHSDTGYEKMTNFYYYASVVIKKLRSTDSRDKLDLSDEVFVNLLKEFAIIASRYDSLDLSAQRWYISALKNAIVEFIKNKHTDLVNELFLLLETNLKAKRRSSRDLATIAYYDMISFEAHYYNRDDVVEQLLKCIDLCVKRSTQLGTACNKMLFLLWRYFNEKNFALGESVKDKMATLVKGKDFDYLCQWVDYLNYYIYKELEQDEENKEKLNEYRILDFALAKYIDKKADELYSNSYGISAKEFFKMKKTEQFSARVLEVIFEKIKDELFLKLGEEE